MRDKNIHDGSKHKPSSGILYKLKVSLCANKLVFFKGNFALLVYLRTR